MKSTKFRRVSKQIHNSLLALIESKLISFSLFLLLVNKHKPWIETSYHGVITENTDVVQLDPPLVALDKDAPVPYAGKARNESFIGYWVCSTVLHTHIS